MLKLCWSLSNNLWALREISDSMREHYPEGGNTLKMALDVKDLDVDVL